MPVKFANSSEQSYDFICLRRRFGRSMPAANLTFRLPVATSDSDDVENAGDDDEWEDINRIAMPSNRIRLVADYLLESGQAAI